ncbi:MAG: zinc-ribbon and DUF3426 domain-containing protein [Pseudomonadota bacterium]
MIIEVTCPACGTVFALDQASLKPDDPRVRCGECGAVFEVDAESASPSDDRPFAETGVGWVVVASRDAPEETPDDPGARYVPADEAESWGELGAPENDADIDHTADPAGGDAAAESDSEATVEAAIEQDQDADDASRNAETLTFEPPPPPPLAVVEKPAPAGDDWQALLAEIDTLPDLEAASVADDDGTGHGAEAEAEADEIPATPPHTAELADDAPSNGERLDDATVFADLLADEASDATGLDKDSATIGASSDIIDSGEAVLADATGEMDGADDGDNDEFVLTLDVDAASDTPTTDVADADLAATAEADAAGGSDAVPGSGLPEPSDEEIMREFTVSASDFLPADDAFVEAVVDNFILEADDDALAAETANALDLDLDQPATADTGPTADDDTPDTSGIFVSETRLPDHAGELLPASTAAHAEADSDEALFETAIGMASEPEPPTVWTRYGGAAAAIAAVVLMAQALHQYRADLATVGWLNPVYFAIYGERLAPAWDIRDLCFEQRDASANETAMRVVGRVRNRAEQPLPYPLVHVTLLSRFDDGNGTAPLAHRLLDADRYLLGNSPAERIAPGTSFDVEALLRDPGEQASGYELEVCFRRDDGQLACNSGC